MAAWLAIDWDQDQFHVLSVQTSRRGVQVVSAATWAHPEPFTPSTAERVGKALRDFLKAQRIAPAPVLVGLGRDRIILKELRFPPIAPHEEAALVRFQTAKELTESPDSYAIDYAYLNADKASGDRHVMAAAVRRDFVVMIQTLCQAAGLKLHAITPRLFGVGPALTHAALPDPNPLTPNRRNVVLSLGQRWAELCFFRGDRLVQAQAVATGPHLVNEIKRNLAVFQAQHAVEVDVQGPDALHLFGDDPVILQALQAGLNMPIVELDPLEQSPELPARMKNPGAFAGGLGLALLWTQSARTPINLAAPKRHHAPTSISQQRGMFYGAAAAALLLLLIGTMWYIMADRNAKIRALAKHKSELEQTLKLVAQERADLEAYKEWEQTTIPWLDEVYDLTARYPFETGFRVNQFAAVATSKKKGAKDDQVARISVNGYAPTGKSGEAYVEKLHAAIKADPHVRASLNHSKANPPHMEYQMIIDVSKQAADKYATSFVAPPPPAPKIRYEKIAPKTEAKEELKKDADPDGDQ